MPTEPRADQALEELVSATAQGDEHAFGVLYDGVAPAVLGMVRALVRDPAAGEALAEEVFVELWRTAPSYRPDRGGPVAWAMAVAHRRAVSARGGEHAAPSARGAGRPPADPGERANAERELVDKGLGALSEQNREAVLLTYYDGRTYREVAAALAVEPETVRDRLREGLRRLGEFLNSNR